MKITKAALYTDIHFGKRNNSIVHNQDCLDFISWFCDKVKADPSISHIIFLGDFFENRAAISVMTLDMAYRGLKMLDSLGLPVIHIVGNHDLYRRSTREIHSVNIFNELKNFTIVDEPTLIDECMFIPFIFEDEYPTVVEDINNSKYVYGHLEFKNFMITGYNMRMKHGPDHTKFSGPDLIMSGHFHKRQANDNVCYIGNTFPMDFGDAGDSERGMTVHNLETGDVDFCDWDNGPSYLKTSLSAILNDNWTPKEKMRVRCIVDVDISYSEAQLIKEGLMEAHNLREFSFEENGDKQEALEGDDGDEEFEAQSIDEMVITLLESISDVNTIKNDKLIGMYNSLKDGS